MFRHEHHALDREGIGWVLAGRIPGTALGAVVGLPSLRLSGLQFATASLAFATAASSWLFVWGDLPRSMPRGDLVGLDLSSDIAVYFVMLSITAVFYLAAWNLRRSAQGRLLLAARDASATVAHFGTSPARARLGVFLLASFTATLGGGLYAVLVSGLSAGDFTPFLSLTLLVYFVVGGSQSLLGPILAGIAFGVLPQVLQSEVGASADAKPTIFAGAAVIVLLALRPGGLASLVGADSPAAARSTRVSPTPSEAYEETRRRLATASPARVLHAAGWARTRGPNPLLTHRR
jgi:branched-chain amino acid transport system permease protein